MDYNSNALHYVIASPRLLLGMKNSAKWFMIKSKKCLLNTKW